MGKNTKILLKQKMLVWLVMLEKIGNEKGKIEDFVIKELVKIGVKTIGKWIHDNAKYFGPIQENIQPELILKIKISV